MTRIKNYKKMARKIRKDGEKIKLCSRDGERRHKIDRR